MRATVHTANKIQHRFRLRRERRTPCSAFGTRQRVERTHWQPGKSNMNTLPVRTLRRPKRFLPRLGGCILLLLVQTWSQRALQAQPGEASQESYDAESVKAGGTLFGERCSVCHGIDGRGSARGPALTSGLVVNRGSDEEVAQVIRQGVPNSSMPPFVLPDAEIRQLVAFIRSLSTNAARLSVPGDTDSGKRIFFGKGRCSECHMIRGEGGLLGPDLSNLGNERTLAEIRESVLTPGLREEMKYRTVTIVTQKGDRITGTLRNRDNFSLQTMDANGKLHSFLSSELREVLLEEKSAMPDNYEKVLTAAELQDLLAFLSRQSVGN